MFNKTRAQLVILNSAVLVLILLVSGFILYSHLSYRLFHQVDEAIVNITRAMQASSIDQMLQADHPEPDPDRRTSYFFWDDQGKLINQYPKQLFSLDDAARFKRVGDSGNLQNVSIGGREYRVLGFRNPMNKTFDSPSLPHSSYVVVVRSLEAENKVLQTLRTDISMASVIGVLFSIMAGFYLAGRSLVPIRKSWDKQQQFVADASHELRTPTAVIQTRAELLFRHPQHTIEQESQNIALILKESKRMGKLIDDLLTLARTDSNQLQINAATIPLDPILQDLAEQFELLAETKSIRIHSHFQPSVILGDESRLRQLFIILLDNALKFTPPHGSIEFTCHSLPNAIRVIVKDSGCGIAEADLPHIFERFYRGDKSRSRTEGGTGLGLSIAEWIVHAHKGSIRVTSRIAIGTEFQISFPKKN
ncbi:HAMP domain-containing histidine kinase [Paenibacillus alginolyticus]|uniref:histidine kinase n=1 Tax=Paenibacillus alginolyticus TaxID=59839 RepID=A0ABT4GPN8_9BACL|nr:ATP-binding protein [Paenibacillus alginolyticus]MCY9670337.1 HAMP domain-containing histidine kinase [Paenibacillus alginolyticus]MCY9698188.1 HAMP domain-containing histidine kinase [Paenibacillus alginolyticus]MEC0148523.1 ATP-binding protein [Paenibacillus alginolyticus]